MAKLTNQFPRTRITTSSPDKHYSLNFEDDSRSRSGCQNVSHQKQFSSELPSPGSVITLYESLNKVKNLVSDT